MPAMDLLRAKSPVIGLRRHPVEQDWVMVAASSG
jgi:hypothetical protein